jgi:prepilin-type N-terminal cleavage/methylation domain-containing protein
MRMLVATARRQTGVTLVEMVLVVAVLAVAATLAIPMSEPAGDAAAASAAGDVAQAVRFAQREAMRTGSFHVAEINPATQTIRVYRLTDTGAVSGVKVNHPFDKLEYRISLAGKAPHVRITSSVFTYGADRTVDVAFSPDGTPLRYVTGQLPSAALSADGSVGLQAGAAQRTVLVDRTTGRVTL